MCVYREGDEKQETNNGFFYRHFIIILFTLASITKIKSIMKLKIILSLLVMILSISSSYASFPVTRATSNNITITDSIAEEDTMESPAATPIAGKKMSTALLLWFFLWWPGVHRWYLGSPWGWNILYLLTFGGLGIWAIFDLVDIITENYPGL